MTADRLELGVALIDPRRDTFTRDEVALLMATAYRWGYEQRTEEEEAQLIPITYSASELIRDMERASYRRECDNRVRGDVGRQG